MRSHSSAALACSLLALVHSACSGELNPLLRSGDAGSDVQVAPDAKLEVDAGLRAGECRTTDDCGEGEHCSTTSGCVESHCGMPESIGGGSLPLRASCSAGPCSAGLVCAEVAAGPDVTPQNGSRCAWPCDPCQPSCPEKLTCLQIEGRKGGFCALPLRPEGQPCSAVQHCLAGLVCDCVRSPCSCRRPCTPNEGQDQIAFGSAALSDDCSAPGLCIVVAQSVAGDRHQCRPGKPVPTGHLCYDPLYTSDTAYCLFPDICRAVVANSNLVAVCTPTSCEGGCPVDVPCSGGTHCIRDGVLPISAHCLETRNCRSGLICRPVPGEAAGKPRCQPST